MASRLVRIALSILLVSSALPAIRGAALPYISLFPANSPGAACEKAQASDMQEMLKVASICTNETLNGQPGCEALAKMNLCFISYVCAKCEPEGAAQYIEKMDQVTSLVNTIFSQLTDLKCPKVTHETDCRKVDSWTKWQV